MRQNRSAPARTTTLLAMKKTELNPIEVKQNMKKKRIQLSTSEIM